METQLNLGLPPSAVEVAQLRQTVAAQDKEIEELSRRLEMYELKLLEAAYAEGRA